MNRNLILFSTLLFFLIALYAINNWIPIIDVSKAEDVYMSNKENKIKRVKIYHKAAKESYIFSKMMENNKGGLINAVIKNHSKFWQINNKSGIFEGFDSKFDQLIQSIIKDNKLKIDYRGSTKLGKGKYADKKTQLYQLSFRCEYEDLLVFVSEMEKNDRIYNIEELKIKNPLQKNNSGIIINMKINEINLGV